MFLYTVLAALIGLAAAIWLAARAKKVKDLTYGSLDKVGRVTNLILLVLYSIFAPFYMFLGMICTPAYDGFLGVLGWIVSIVCASAAPICFLGLGFSVALRKKGKKIPSFLAQFAGIIGICLTVLLYYFCAGNLLSSLNGNMPA